MSNCTRKIKKLHESERKGRKRSHVTLLTKTTVLLVIGTIDESLKITVANAVRKAGMFSVQLDIRVTQDITYKDQYTVTLK